LRCVPFSRGVQQRKKNQNLPMEIEVKVIRPASSQRLFEVGCKRNASGWFER
jgi:hypothetical protein